jgi:hypothetical protein
VDLVRGSPSPGPRLSSVVAICLAFA